MSANSLQEQLQEIENGLEQEKQRGALRDASKIAELEAQQADILERMMLEEREEKVNADIPFAVSGIDFTDLPVEIVTLIDQVVKADRRRLLNEHAIELEMLEDENKSLDGNLQEAANKAEEYRERLEELEEVHIDYVRIQQGIVHELDLRITDAESKRDAAVENCEAMQGALDEALAEIKRLGSEIDDYQKAKTFGERESQQIIDVTSEESNGISEALAAVRKLVNPTVEEKAAKAVDSWSLRNPDLAIPSIQVPQFPGYEHLDQSSETDSSIPDAAVNYFPSSGESVDGESETVGPEANGDDRPVTRAEFEEMKSFVGKLEFNQDGSVTWNRPSMVA